MAIPDYLQHKPVIGVDNYQRIDGHYLPTETDARALSIGQAQYDDTEFSAKVFRHTGNNWSRQSEELPLHRVLDLAILLVASMKGKTTDNGIHELFEEVVNPDKLPDLQAYYQKHIQVLQPRLDELKRLL